MVLDRRELEPEGSGLREGDGHSVDVLRGVLEQRGVRLAHDVLERRARELERNDRWRLCAPDGGNGGGAVRLAEQRQLAKVVPYFFVLYCKYWYL